jgi:hypothetical protein
MLAIVFGFANNSRRSSKSKTPVGKTVDVHGGMAMDPLRVMPVVLRTKTVGCTKAKQSINNQSMRHS